MRKPEEVTRALNRYAVRQRLSQAFVWIGIVFLVLDAYIGFLGIQGGLMISEPYRARVPVTEIKSGDSLFWWLSNQAFLEHPKVWLRVVAGVALAGGLFLLAGYLAKPAKAE